MTQTLVAKLTNKVALDKYFILYVIFQVALDKSVSYMSQNIK